MLTRNVDPGNAVAASLQAVTLFTVAEDLKQLRLQVNVDEADVGSVTVGQKAQFTVSAYPGRKYPAVVTRVAFGSTITDNVVTYVTYLDVDNSDLSLRPGMTATATITATSRNDVLLVPNTALRFEPAIGAALGRAGREGRRDRRQPDAAHAAGAVREAPPRTAPAPRRRARSGCCATESPSPVAVTPGISDGRMTEIIGGDSRRACRSSPTRKPRRRNERGAASGGTRARGPRSPRCARTRRPSRDRAVRHACSR